MRLSGTPRASGLDGDVRLAVSTARRHLRLTFRDGDDPPVPVTRAVGLYRPEELLFEARGEPPYTLLLDTDEPEVPSFDFEARLRRSGDVTWRGATFGPLTTVARQPRQQPAGPTPRSERLRRPLTLGLVVVLAGLAAWTLRLLRRR